MIASSDNRYSQFVTWSKIILPLIAIGLLSTLFLFSHSPADEGLIPFAEIEEIARDNRLSNPNFSGVGANGVIFTISASEARPDPANRSMITIDGTRVSVSDASGSRLEVVAGTATINTTDKVLTTGGLTRVSATRGYLMETEGLVASIEAGTLESTGPLEVRAPFGTMTAGRMLVRGANDDGGLMIVFNKGVRLVYLPAEKGE